MSPCWSGLLLVLSTLLASARRSSAAPMARRQSVGVGVPPYVLDYAPLVWLESNEVNWPSDVTTHLQNVQADTGATQITTAPSPLTADSLNAASINADDTYLTSVSDPASSPQPAYLLSTYGRPDSTGKSAASQTLVLVNKTGVVGQDPAGDLDAFYFFFYSFNLGPDLTLTEDHYGNHVGDWEHMMIRFSNGVPVGVYYSQHDSGASYTYDAVSKVGARPVGYSAVGSHANYPSAGTKDYAGVPIVLDHCDQGTLWDYVATTPEAYWYTASPETFTPAVNTTLSPDFLYFTGKWGDQAYPPDDPRQSYLPGILEGEISKLIGDQRWVDGPTGPRNKTLIRTSLSPDPSQQVQTSVS